MCQHIIDDDFIRSGIFYKQMNTCLHYAFHETGVLYAATTRQAKQTSGCYPVNYLLTDEFKLKPFTQMDRPAISKRTCAARDGKLCPMNIPTYPMAKRPISPVRMRMHSSIGMMKILPSPMLPVRALLMMASTVGLT